MLRIHGFVFGLLLYVPIVTAQTALAWEKSVGGSNLEEIRNLALCPDGGWIAVGSSASNDGDILTNKGQEDYLIARFDASANVKWIRTYGGKFGDVARSVALTSDGGFIVGGNTRSQGDDVGPHNGYFDMWILKLDSLGNIQWKKTFGGSGFDNCYRVIELSDGTFVVAGFTESVDGDAVGNHGGRDVLVLRLTTTGSVLWRKVLGGTADEESACVLETASGKIMVVGYAESIDGDLTTNEGSSDIWILLMDKNGNVLWNKTYGGTSKDVGRWIMQTEPNRFVIAANVSSFNGTVQGAYGNYDMCVLAIDSNGMLIWYKSLGGTAYDYAYHVSLTLQQTYLVTGITYSNDHHVSVSHGSGDYFAACLNASGTVLWTKNFGGSKKDECRGGFQLNNDMYLFAGYAISEDKEITSPKGSSDGWFVGACVAPLQYYPDEDGDAFGAAQGNAIWSCTQPAGYVANTLDCDDANADAHPNAMDLCNGMDENCNGIIDDFSVSISLIANGSLSFCSNTPTELSVSNTYNFTSFQWLRDGEIISGATNATFSPTVSGTYWVQLSNAFCGVTTQSLNVEVLPAPQAVITNPNPTTVCDKKSVTLHAATGSLYQYQWNKNGQPIAGATNSSYTFKGSGTNDYTVTVTNTYGCTAVSNPVTVIYQPLPTAQITPLGSLDICTTGSVVLEASSGPNYSYSWYRDNVKISQATSQTYTATTTGSYKVRVTDEYGCKKKSPAVVVFNSCGKEKNPPVLVLNGNPTGRLIRFRLLGNREATHAIYFADLLGRNLADVKPYADDESAGYVWRIPDYVPNGLYLLMLVTDTHRSSVLLVLNE